MQSERDRMSLREIEARLRESDDELVRSFEILGADGPRRVPPRQVAPGSAPPPERPLRRPAWLAVALVSVVVLGWGLSGAPLSALAVTLGVPLAVVLYLVAATARPRRRR